ncbi:MAG: hypothetical protein GXP25_14340, partial [Planctomycetes bacterium]|nr:hypothetical protein [Planctomycetota bacterium]
MRLSIAVPVLLYAVTSFITSPLHAADIFTIDFEQGADVAKYADRLDVGKMQAAIVEGGRDGKGHCLKIHNTEPGTACPLILKGPIEVK